MEAQSLDALCFRYREYLKKHCKVFREKKPQSPRGQVFYGGWGSNRFAANSAVICLKVKNLLFLFS